MSMERILKFQTVGEVYNRVNNVLTARPFVFLCNLFPSGKLKVLIVIYEICFFFAKSL